MRRQKYPDGREIRVGDRIFYHGQPGTIVFVADHGEYSPGYPKEEWPGIQSGFMIEFTNGARLHLDAPDGHFAKTREESLMIEDAEP